MPAIAPALPGELQTAVLAVDTAVAKLQQIRGLLASAATARADVERKLEATFGAAFGALADAEASAAVDGTAAAPGLRKTG
jgi:hypothetical protein